MNPLGKYALTRINRRLLSSSHKAGKDYTNNAWKEHLEKLEKDNIPELKRLCKQMWKAEKEGSLPEDDPQPIAVESLSAKYALIKSRIKQLYKFYEAKETHSKSTWQEHLEQLEQTDPLKLRRMFIQMWKAKKEQRSSPNVAPEPAEVDSPLAEYALDDAMFQKLYKFHDPEKDYTEQAYRKHVKDLAISNPLEFEKLCREMSKAKEQEMRSDQEVVSQQGKVSIPPDQYALTKANVGRVYHLSNPEGRSFAEIEEELGHLSRKELKRRIRDAERRKEENLREKKRRTRARKARKQRKDNTTPSGTTYLLTGLTTAQNPTMAHNINRSTKPRDVVVDVHIRQQTPFQRDDNKPHMRQIEWHSSAKPDARLKLAESSRLLENSKPAEIIWNLETAKFETRARTHYDNLSPTPLIRSDMSGPLPNLQQAESAFTPSSTPKHLVTNTELSQDLAGGLVIQPDRSEEPGTSDIDMYEGSLDYQEASPELGTSTSDYDEGLAGHREPDLLGFDHETGDMLCIPATPEPEGFLEDQQIPRNITPEFELYHVESDWHDNVEDEQLEEDDDYTSDHPIAESTYRACRSSSAGLELREAAVLVDDPATSTSEDRRGYADQPDITDAIINFIKSTTPETREINESNSFAELPYQEGKQAETVVLGDESANAPVEETRISANRPQTIDMPRSPTPEVRERPESDSPVVEPLESACQVADQPKSELVSEDPTEDQYPHVLSVHPTRASAPPLRLPKSASALAPLTFFQDRRRKSRLSRSLSKEQSPDLDSSPEDDFEMYQEEQRVSKSARRRPSEQASVWRSHLSHAPANGQSSDRKSVLLTAISKDTFGLPQERVDHDPFLVLLAAVLTFRNDKAREPITTSSFLKVFEKFPEPSDLVYAYIGSPDCDSTDDEDVPDEQESSEDEDGTDDNEITRSKKQNEKRVLQNLLGDLPLWAARAWTLIRLARARAEVGPSEDEMALRTVPYPVHDYELQSLKEAEMKQFSALKTRFPTLVISNASLPHGFWAYVRDCWRIFRNGMQHGEEEWKHVQPQDKTLRAYLQWRWLKCGYEWDPNTGKTKPADTDVMRWAARGLLCYDVSDTD
jgi:hypothetical protein